MGLSPEMAAVLEEDARAFPAFAAERRAAVEDRYRSRDDGTHHAVRYIVDELRAYEETRGSGKRPPLDVPIVAAYERARGLG